MNHKSKKEIWDELQMYKKRVKQYENFWEVQIIDEYEKHLIKIHRIINILIVISLMGISFILGLGW